MEQKRHSSSVWSEIEPYCLLRMLARNLWMILMAAVSFSLLAYIAVTLLLKPTYTSSITFAVTPKNTLSSGNITVSASTAEQFSSLLSSSLFTKQIQHEYGAAVSGVTVTASPIEDTNVIRVDAVGSTPSSVYYMASGIVENYRE